jgi:hypothetical protein
MQTNPVGKGPTQAGVGWGGDGGSFGPAQEFVDMIIANVLRHLPFNQNQPMKSADD